MGAPRIELVKRAFDAFNRDDVEGLIQTAHPTIEMRPLRALVEGDVGVYHGHDGLRAFMHDSAESWGQPQLALESFRESGGQILVTGRLQARGRTSGVSLDTPVAWLIDVRDGLIVRIETFTDPENAALALEREE